MFWRRVGPGPYADHAPLRCGTGCRPRIRRENAATKETDEHAMPDVSLARGGRGWTAAGSRRGRVSKAGSSIRARPQRRDRVQHAVDGCRYRRRTEREFVGISAAHAKQRQRGDEQQPSVRPARRTAGFPPSRRERQRAEGAARKTSRKALWTLAAFLTVTRRIVLDPMGSRTVLLAVLHHDASLAKCSAAHGPRATPGYTFGTVTWVPW